MKDKVTIKDIAKATGVSASTVSRIINNKGKYTQETRQAVWDAIRDLKYSPNILAKSLRSKRSTLVGIMVPTLYDDFFGVLADHLARELLQFGFAPMVYSTYNDEEIEKRYCSMLVSLNASGMIYILKETPVYEEGASIPTIFIGNAPEVSENSVRILFDIVGGAKEATQELVDAGCRRIVYIESARRRESRVGRYLGYQQALWENGIPIDESLVITVGGKDYADISDALGRLIDRGIPFDGVFSNKVSGSIEVINFLKKKGLRVPEDIKIVSFENGRPAELYNPGISAIEMDTSQASESAVSILREMIERQEPLKKTIRIPAVLHRRETSVIERDAETGGIPGDRIEDSVL